MAVITNASLIGRKEVREALNPADRISLKVDTVRETVWKEINRPHPALLPAAQLEAMPAFARDYSGQMMTGTTDAVIFIASLQFVDDYRRAVAEAWRVLKPAGRLIAFLLNPESPFFKEKRGDPDSYRAGSGSGRGTSRRRPRNYSWSQLMARISAVDVPKRSRCGARMRILCAVPPPEAIRKILECPGIPPPDHHRSARRWSSTILAPGDC